MKQTYIVTVKLSTLKMEEFHKLIKIYPALSLTKALNKADRCSKYCEKHKHTQKCVGVCVCVCTCVCTCVCACVCTCKFVCACVCVYDRVCVCVHAHGCLGEYKKNGQTLTLVVIDTLRAIALVVSGLGVKGAVDWQLQVVAAQPVSVRVRVRVQATLKQVVGLV